MVRIMFRWWLKIINIVLMILIFGTGISFGQNEHRPISSSDARRMENEMRRIWFWLAHWDVRHSAPRDRDGKAGEHFLYISGSTCRIYFHDGSVWKYIDVSNSTFSNYLLKSELTDSLNARGFYSASDTVNTLATQYDLTQLAGADSDWVRISADSFWVGDNNAAEFWRDGSGNLTLKDANAGNVTLNNMLLRDGTTALTADWAAGNYKITAHDLATDSSLYVGNDMRVYESSLGRMIFNNGSTNNGFEFYNYLLGGLDFTARLMWDEIDFYTEGHNRLWVKNTHIGTNVPFYFDGDTGNEKVWEDADSLKFADVATGTKTLAELAAVPDSSWVKADADTLMANTSLKVANNLEIKDSGGYLYTFNIPQNGGAFDFYSRNSLGTNRLIGDFAAAGWYLYDDGSQVLQSVTNGVQVDDTLQFNDRNTQLFEDGSGNLNLKDANAGTVTLNNILLRDGTLGLTGNWDAGNYEVRARTFNSDVATGTAPFTVASQTKVNSLNADYLDGYDYTHWISLNEPIVTTTATAGSNAERVLTAGSGITVTDGGANTTITVAADIAGDATAGRVMRFGYIVIDNGTNVNTIKCTFYNRWNADDIPTQDNISPASTSGGFSLGSMGYELRVEADSLSGNVVAAMGKIDENSTGTAYTVQLKANLNDIRIYVLNLNASLQDLTSLVDSGSLRIAMIYVTDN